MERHRVLHNTTLSGNVRTVRVSTIIGMDTGTLCSGSGILLIDLASKSPVVFILRTPKKHAILQYGNPLNMFREEKGETVHGCDPEH